MKKGQYTKEEVVTILEFLRKGSYDLNFLRRKLRHNLPKEAFRQDGKLYAIWKSTIKEYVTDLKNLIKYKEGAKLDISDLNNL